MAETPVARMKTISALGLDVGRKRIGVAGCDRTGLIATGLTTIEYKSMRAAIDAIKSIVIDRQVEILVIGLPYLADGTLGVQAKQIQKFAETLSRVLELPFEYVDERLTSVEAEQLLQAEKISVAWNKGLVDRKAAALILQQWLDQRREKGTHFTRYFSENES